MSNHARCVFEVSAAVRSIWNLKKKKLDFRINTLRLRFLSDGLRVGDGGERVSFSLLQKPSEAVSNRDSNSNCVASVFAEETLLMTPSHKRGGG